MTTISDSYRELLTKAHAEDANWGTSASRRVGDVLALAAELKAPDVLDYGCGKGVLVKALAENGVSARGYDPAMPEFKEPPKPAGLVTCIDVLEHVEPEHLDAVLAELRGLAPVAYLVIALFPARKILPDGRNAHLIIQPAAWWLVALESVWKRVAVRALSASWLVVVAHREAQ